MPKGAEVYRKYHQPTVSFTEYSHCEQYKSIIEAEELEKEASIKRAAATVEGDSSQRMLTSCFEEWFPFTRSTPLWNKLMNPICYFTAKDMQPYDTVNDKGFQHLIHTFQPR